MPRGGSRRGQRPWLRTCAPELGFQQGTLPATSASLHLALHLLLLLELQVAWDPACARCRGE